MAHALGDDRAAGVGSVSPPKTTGTTKSLPGSLRDRYTNTTTTTGLNETTTTENDNNNNNKSAMMIRGNNVPSSRIVGFGTSPAVPVLARGGGKSFTERARSKLEQLKHKTQEALQARKERQQREQQQQQQQQGTTTSGSVQNESTRELTRAMRRETVSEVVASATSAAELLFELRTCGLTDSGEGGEPDASTHDMIAEMTHVCEERRARLAGLAGNEGLSEANLVLVLETIEKVNGALDSGIDGPPSTTTTTTTTTTFIAASGEDENVVPAPPANPIGVSAGNPFATPALSSPTTPSTRTVTRMDVPQTPEEEEAALAAAIAASLQIEDENKRKTTESQSLSLPAPPPPQQQQQQVSDSNDIGNLIDF